MFGFKNDVEWFISVFGAALSCYMFVWIGVDKFLYKGNVGFLREMLSKFSKTHVFFFFFCNNLVITYLN